MEHISEGASLHRSLWPSNLPPLPEGLCESPEDQPLGFPRWLVKNWGRWGRKSWRTCLRKTAKNSSACLCNTYNNYCSWASSFTSTICTGWWFGTFCIFPYIGNFIIPTDELHYFSEGWPNHQPAIVFAFWSYEMLWSSVANVSFLYGSLSKSRKLSKSSECAVSWARKLVIVEQAPTVKYRKRLTCCWHARPNPLPRAILGAGLKHLGLMGFITFQNCTWIPADAGRKMCCIELLDHHAGQIRTAPVQAIQIVAEQKNTWHLAGLTTPDPTWCQCLLQAAHSREMQHRSQEPVTSCWGSSAGGPKALLNAAKARTNCDKSPADMICDPVIRLSISIHLPFTQLHVRLVI